MVTCPNCRHNNLQGALFCTQCGALLEGVARRTTQKVHQTTGRLEPGPTSSAPIPAVELEAQMNLYVVDSGQVLQLAGQEEFTLGRAASGQPIAPDIDLSPYRAYELGVSRLHAVIRLEGKKIVLMDLGSVNGTRLNSQKIQPHKPVAVTHGDILTLGKLKLQLLLRPTPQPTVE